MDSWIIAAQARAELATPGPWHSRQRHVDAKPGDDEFGGLGCEVDGPPEPLLRGQFSRGADGQFIAAARSDVPRLCTALLEAVEALGAIADEHCAFGWGMKCDAVIDECPACRARRVLTRIQADPEGE